MFEKLLASVALARIDTTKLSIHELTALHDIAIEGGVDEAHRKAHKEAIRRGVKLEYLDVENSDPQTYVTRMEAIFSVAKLSAQSVGVKLTTEQEQQRIEESRQFILAELDRLFPGQPKPIVHGASTQPANKATIQESEDQFFGQLGIVPPTPLTN